MNLGYSTDIVIFGGGIAGLWLLKRLRLEGYQAILLETKQLGSGQTLASQGIIHGGLKYALSGRLGEAAHTLAAMPSRWRSCLAGEDPMDLRKVRLLSEHCYLWSGAGFRSRLQTYLGSRSLRGRVQAVTGQDLPGFFSQTCGTGTLYRLPDFVIDSASLLAELRKGQEDNLFLVPAHAISFRRGAAQQIHGISIDQQGGAVLIDCQKCIFSAGAGNAELMARCGADTIGMQRRPLHMVYVQRKNLPTVYAHCIGDDFSLRPELTITSHRDGMGVTLWYLGGELAESGIHRTGSEQVAAARAQLQSRFPRTDLAAGKWCSFVIDRAEARTADSRRPDDAVFGEQDNTLTVFPTKLTLLPSLADRIVRHLQASAVTKGSRDGPDTSALHLRQHFPAPLPGSPHWDRCHASRQRP